MGILRPGVDAPNRKYFNFFHYLVGYSAQILAFAALYLGMQIFALAGMFVMLHKLCIESYKWYKIYIINSIDVFRLVEIPSNINRSDMVCNNGPDTFHKKYPNSWKNSSDSIFPGLHWRIRCNSIPACTSAMKNIVHPMGIKTFINNIKYKNFYMHSFI